jgi:predicted N-acetyltransferase YhbS
MAQSMCRLRAAATCRLLVGYVPYRARVGYVPRRAHIGYVWFTCRLRAAQSTCRFVGLCVGYIVFANVSELFPAVVRRAL